MEVVPGVFKFDSGPFNFHLVREKDHLTILCWHKLTIQIKPEFTAAELIRRTLAETKGQSLEMLERDWQN